MEATNYTSTNSSHVFAAKELTFSYHITAVVEISKYYYYSKIMVVKDVL